LQDNYQPRAAGAEGNIIKESSIKTEPEIKIEKKIEYRETKILNSIKQEQSRNQQKQDLQNAIIFANAAAIGISLFQILKSFYHFSIIFIVAIGIAYFLRSKNNASSKLGIFGLIIVLNYFIVTRLFSTIIWPSVLGYHTGIGFYFFIRMIFYAGNLKVLIAGGLAYLLSANQLFFRNLNKKNDF
jgi:hypothetical protein